MIAFLFGVSTIVSSGNDWVAEALNQAAQECTSISLEFVL
jgi:hypothetical protein